MERIPEPELMDDAAQARAYAEADFSEPHQRFVELFCESFPSLEVEGTLLDLGCGPGDVACRFALRFAEARVHGVDGAEAMLAESAAVIGRHGVRGRVELFQGYLPGARLPLPSYPVIISNSLLHHLSDPSILWRSVREYAEPGAAVFVMDLMRPESEEQAQELTRQYAGGEPEVLRRDFLHSLRAAYTVEEVREQLQRARLPLQVRPVSDRHLIVWGAGSQRSNIES